VSEATLRRGAEVALVAIAAVWGLTFVMVQDAIALLPTMAFLLLSGAGGGFEARGDGLVLLCALAFSAHILATDRAVARHDPGALLAVQLGLCGVVCLAIAASAPQLEAPEGSTVWSALVVTSLVASALGFFVQTFAQRHAPPSRTALILASEPAFAGLFGWLLAGERLSPLALLGATLILTAIVALEVVGRLRPPRPLPEG
jgi:drug/metabolite transporter (DMT)-like permease